ncbi:hypothetical protein KSS87_010685 [Heliosperma pusillum]|nr:hypothetical protein KSS87_010685 [Heliosperma pusillum]
MKVKQLNLCDTYRSIKPHCNPNYKSETKSAEKLSDSRKQEWCVYLIASTNPPFKTYIGVTTDFSRRLKQHNGELPGGAKASRAGRPWLCACLIQGFSTHSLGISNASTPAHATFTLTSSHDSFLSSYPFVACQFESQWKNTSRKMPRRRTVLGVQEEKDKGLHLLLRHRYAAMDRLKDSFDFDNLQLDWQLTPF